jgi:hypothetical protein
MKLMITLTMCCPFFMSCMRFMCWNIIHLLCNKVLKNMLALLIVVLLEMLYQNFPPADQGFFKHVRSNDIVWPLKTDLDVYLEEDVYICENDINEEDIDMEFEALAWCIFWSSIIWLLDYIVDFVLFFKIV